MRTIIDNIGEKVIDNLLTTCQSESDLIPNFAPLKQETGDLYAREGIIKQNHYQGVKTLAKSSENNAEFCTVITKSKKWLQEKQKTE